MKSQPQKSYLPLILIGSAILVLGLWIGSYWIIVENFGSPNDPGLFGDMFGAVNSLFSGLAFVGIIIAIYLQSRELKLQREELELTRNELEKQATALTASFDIQKKAFYSNIKPQIEVYNQRIEEYPKDINIQFSFKSLKHNFFFNGTSLSGSDASDFTHDQAKTFRNRLLTPEAIVQIEIRSNFDLSQSIQKKIKDLKVIIHLEDFERNAYELVIAINFNYRDHKITWDGETFHDVYGLRLVE